MRMGIEGVFMVVVGVMTWVAAGSIGASVTGMISVAGASVAGGWSSVWVGKRVGCAGEVFSGAAGSGAALWQADSARTSRRMSEVLKVDFIWSPWSGK